VPKLLGARASRNAEEKHKILNLARSPAMLPQTGSQKLESSL